MFLRFRLLTPLYPGVRLGWGRGCRGPNAFNLSQTAPRDGSEGDAGREQELGIFAIDEDAGGDGVGNAVDEVADVLEAGK